MGAGLDRFELSLNPGSVKLNPLCPSRDKPILTTNPFPGMNPYLEGSWGNVYTRLIGHIADALSEELPSDLNAMVEQGIEIGHEEPLTQFRGDVAISEFWPPGLLESRLVFTTLRSRVAPYVLCSERVYYCPLREALPTIRVPLRVTDLDVPLALQPLIDRIYHTGRCWQVSHRHVPAPPLPVEDADWVVERLQAAPLR